MNLNEHEALTKDEIEHVQQITNTGDLYYDYDPLIEKARNYSYYLCRQYNQSFTNHSQGDLQILKKLFKEIGDGVKIDPGFITEFGFNTTIGEQTIIGRDFKMIDCNVVKIGKFVTIGDQVGIYTSNHAMDPQKRAQHWCSEKPIIIGDGVVIEDNVTILPGVMIGDNAVIRAASVVTHNIPANEIASGVPCETIGGKINAKNSSFRR